MSARSFLDTNVIVYLFDERAPAKRLIAGRLMQGFIDEQIVPVVSTQVLEEVYSTITRKLRVDHATALATLQRMKEASFSVEPIDVPLIWRATSRSAESRLSFWDALIVESARAAQCQLLYSEDLQDGRAFDGVTVSNPFA